MPATRNQKQIPVGLVAHEPLRLAGLASVFEGNPRLQPITGSLDDLLSNRTLGYMVIDLNTFDGLKTLAVIREARPDIRQIVIGPESNDELVLESIMAGARAFLNTTAPPEVVRDAIEVVTSGSIWAPRRLLSKLIDRLMVMNDASLTNVQAHLTHREEQVLELVLKARSNSEIARQLGIGQRTVKGYVSQLMKKTGADNRIELSVRTFNRSHVEKSDKLEAKEMERSTY
jgi:DNA-binding NarL/FixJ family response regulator